MRAPASLPLMRIAPQPMVQQPELDVQTIGPRTAGRSVRSLRDNGVHASRLCPVLDDRSDRIETIVCECQPMVPCAGRSVRSHRDNGLCMPADGAQCWTIGQIASRRLCVCMPAGCALGRAPSWDLGPASHRIRKAAGAADGPEPQFWNPCTSDERDAAKNAGLRSPRMGSRCYHSRWLRREAHLYKRDTGAPSRAAPSPSHPHPHRTCTHVHQAGCQVRPPILFVPTKALARRYSRAPQHLTSVACL
jgi:hypothetical protein